MKEVQTKEEIEALRKHICKELIHSRGRSDSRRRLVFDQS